MDVKKIFLWTAPRCVSTAFERSVMELNRSKIFHEPFSRSYYFGPEKQSTRYKNDEVDKNSSYKDISMVLSKTYPGVNLIFSKDMAYAIENNFGLLLEPNLKPFQHTFLIRNPQKAVPSLYKASINKNLTGWDYFDPLEAGFKQIYDLYHFVVQHFNTEPVVIDADDLLNNPEGTLTGKFNCIR